MAFRACRIGDLGDLPRGQSGSEQVTLSRVIFGVIAAITRKNDRLAVGASSDRTADGKVARCQLTWRATLGGYDKYLLTTRG